MTNEQNRRCAINYLNELKASTSGYSVDWLNTVIKALEQQPSEDCISREAVIKHICESKECYKDECKGRLYKRCFDLQWIYALPSVTPQPKIGRWEFVQYDSNPNIGNWHCSECRTIIPHMPVETDRTPIYKWCPMCGAKMEVEE